MNFKSLIMCIGILMLIGIVYFFYQVASFNLFDNESILLEQIENAEASYKIRVYHIPPNAVTNSSIQIRKFANNGEEVLSSYDKLNRLDSFSIINDTLYLYLSDADNLLPPQKFQLNFKNE